MVGVVDCNNFFVSCERVFAPKLIGKPVVVLSNNDGCVVARSNEAKELNIAMGVPLFKIRGMVTSGQVTALSGNYGLYGDMSRRVMSVIKRHVPDIELYSIDECFVTLPPVEDAAAFGMHLSRTVEQWTGIPVSVGLAPSKTLAKLCSRFAKRYKAYRGCCVIDTEAKRRRALELTAVREVWGIGRKSAAKLERMGVRTAWDFAGLQRDQVSRMMGITGEATWSELNGESVLRLEEPSARKSIQATRSFRDPVSHFDRLHPLIADFCVQVAEKLRKEKSAAREVGVFFATDRFNVKVPFVQRSAVHAFDVATADPREFSTATRRTLSEIYVEGLPVKRAGVWLDGIENEVVQGGLFDRVDRERQLRLLRAVDSVKGKLGRNVLRLASQTHVEEYTRSEYRSKCFTTKLSDILVVK